MDAAILDWRQGVTHQGRANQTRKEMSRPGFRNPSNGENRTKIDPVIIQLSPLSRPFRGVGKTWPITKENPRKGLEIGFSVSTTLLGWGGTPRRRDVLAWPSPWPHRVPQSWPGPRSPTLGHTFYGHPEPDAPLRPPEGSPQASGSHRGPATAERCGVTHIHQKAEEAQLCQPQVLPSTPQHGQRGRLLHPWGGPHPAGAPRGPGGGWSHPRPAWGQTQSCEGQV